MGKVADFCRARQNVSHKTQSMSEAAIIFSGHSLYRTSNKLFGGWSKALVAPAKGFLAALAELHYSVDVVPDWKLDTLSRYRLVVLPDWLDISEDTEKELSAYVKGGGHLIVAGAANVKRLAKLCGIRAGSIADATAWIAGKQMPGTIRGPWLDVALEPGTEVVASRYPDADFRQHGKPAITRNAQVVAVPGPPGFSYDYSHSSAIRDFIASAAYPLYKPQITTDAPPTVEFALRRKERRTVLHMANMSNMQVSSEYITTDHISPAGPFSISVPLAVRPSKATLEPGGQVLQGTWKEGKWTGRIESVPIHNAIVFA